MKRSVAILCLIFFCMLFLGLCPTESRAGTVTLRYANFFPPVHPISKLGEQWGKEIEKRTNGKVKVECYPGGSLVSASETFEAVKVGMADVGLSFCSYTKGRFPLSEVLDLPLGYKSAYVATKLANAFVQKFKPAGFSAVKVVYMHASPPHRINTKIPVRALEDFKGRKIRSTGTSAEVVKALGGVPVSMSMAEAYDALSKGVAEGVAAPFEALKGFKLADVVRYSTGYDSAYSNAAYVVMNKDKWNSLPKDVQKVIDGIDREYMEKQARMWDDLDEGGKKFFVQNGGEVITLSAEENARWTTRLRPILDEYVKEKKKMGLPAAEALQFCVDYLRANQ
jgi:TRAP-type C4-dicarboxylate transport system substrate-binding protein